MALNEQTIPIEREPVEVTAGAVDSVNGKIGDVWLTAEDVEALPEDTFIPEKTSQLENDSDFVTSDDVAKAVSIETTAREQADNSLQGQIDAISASSDVTDIVGTYADLQAYDTSTLGDNNIIKVLQDEEHNDETTYYRWSTSTQTFTLIGEEGPYYTKSAADQKFQGKLTPGSNITIDANNKISATDTVYNDFTGTDGVNAGTAGLVPAPAVSDAGKYLKADGTWDSVSGGIPTTATFWGASYDSVNNKVDGTIKVAGGGMELTNTYQYIKTSTSANFTTGRGLSLGIDSFGNLQISLRNGSGAYGNTISIKNNEIALGLRKISGLLSPTNSTDAATKNYTDNLVISYAALNGSTAPTTATEAKYVGQLYYDTTNDDMYYCSAITAQGTTPETYTYTWNAIGGGGGLDPATTFWGQTASNGIVNGDMTYSDGTHTASIVKYLGATGTTATLVFGNSGPVQLGNGTKSRIEITEQSGNGRIKLWAPNSSILVSGSSFDFYTQTKITNVKNPTNAQDAVTKNYVDTKAIGTSETLTIATTDWTALSASDPYDYSATVTATTTISATSTVELINDQAVLFGTYGFAIGSVDTTNNTVTVYSIGQPSASVSLTIKVRS